MMKMKEKSKDVESSETYIYRLRTRGFDDKLIRNSHTHGLMIIALVLIVSSPIISATSEHSIHSESTSGTSYVFCGLVQDLNDEGNPITCYAIFFIYTNLSCNYPKTVSIICEKHISIYDSFYYRHVSIPGTNMFIIYGVCGNIEINQILK
jgi:hypothetical protein